MRKPQDHLTAVLEPLARNLVDGFDRKRGKPCRKAERVAWEELRGVACTTQTLVADAIMIELASQMVGARTARAWSSWLPGLRGRVRDALPASAVEAAQEVCRQDVQMLGPFYEALALRTDRYKQGQYFTPDYLARFMAQLADTAPSEKVLDPAVGGGVLLASCNPRCKLAGFDVHPTCVAMATAGLRARGAKDLSVRLVDFMDGTAPGSGFDVVICNPPYIRHQLLSKDRKQRLVRRYSAMFDTKVSALSTSYVYFFLETIHRLREGGRLVFITPSDYLESVFGTALKEVFLKHTMLEDILLLEQDTQVFSDAVTTTVITVLRKLPPPGRHSVRFREVKIGGSRISGTGKVNRQKQNQLKPEDGWALNFGGRRKAFDVLVKRKRRVLSDYLRIRCGTATGANKFFVLSEETALEWEIERTHLQPVIASAKDLPDRVFRRKDWEAMRRQGRPCWLLNCRSSWRELKGTRVLRYLQEGVRQGVPERYSCRVRNPWYRIEQVPPPDIIITYMNRDRVRFVRNDARCRILSVFLHGFLLSKKTNIDELLAVLNGDETQKILQHFSRAYGGGLKKIEINKLKSVPMPLL